MKKTETLVIEQDGDKTINLTPMLDIVFIMLIFFIVTATFVKETGNAMRRFMPRRSRYSVSPVYRVGGPIGNANRPR